MESLINKKEWKIDIETERQIWTKNLINIFIFLPDKCEYCNKGVICLRKNNSIINRFLSVQKISFIFLKNAIIAEVLRT